MAQLSFSAEGIDTKDQFDLMPPGLYMAEMTDGEMKESNAGTEYLQLEFTVLGGDFDGRKIWPTFHFNSEKGAAIAQSRMAQLLAAQGKTNINDTDELKGTPVMIRVGIQKSKDPQYEDKNEVKAYKPVEDLASPPKGIASQAATPAQSSAPKAQTPPWERQA